MNFDLTDRCRNFHARLLAFMDEHVYPAEKTYAEQMAESGDPHFQPTIIEQLKDEARRRGLWNLFHPRQDTDPPASGLTNAEYAPLAEIMRRSQIASEACNYSAPDTGNMEVLTLFGTPE